MPGLIGDPDRLVGLAAPGRVKPRHVLAKRPLTGDDRPPVIREVLVLDPAVRLRRLIDSLTRCARSARNDITI